MDHIAYWWTTTWGCSRQATAADLSLSLAAINLLQDAAESCFHVLGIVLVSVVETHHVRLRCRLEAACQSVVCVCNTYISSERVEGWVSMVVLELVVNLLVERHRVALHKC